MADTTYKFKLSGATFRFIASADKSTHSQWEAASGAISVECTVSEDGTTSYELNYHDSINTYPVRFLSNTDGYYYLAPTDTAEALNSYWEKFSYADYSNVLSLVKAETGNDVTVTVGKDAFLAYTSNTITITSEDGSDSENKYKLALPTGATEAEWSDITWTNAANTWSAAGTLSAGWFVKPDTADTISYASATAVQNSFALQSDTFVKNISADTLQQNVKFEGTCVTIGENVLGEGGAKVSSNRENLTVLLSDKLAPTETAAHWETVTETGQEEPTAGKFTYQSASNTAGHTLSGTTITYVPPVGEKSLFTLSNLGENVVLNPTEEELAAGKVAFKVSPDKRTYIGQTEYYGYIVELPKDIFDAAAAALTEDTGTITLSLGEALGELDSIQLYCAEDVPTYKDSIGEDGEVIANQNDATLEAVDGEENQFTYTSNSYSAYYDPITEQPEHKDKSITVHKAEAGKTFTIDGLASDAETANITFTDVAATGAEGQEGYDAAHYLFTVSKDALKEADIVIKNTATGDNLPEIRGAVSGDFASGAEEIDKDASVDGQVVTYTAAGYKAGYLTTKQLKADDSENPTYTKNIHTLSTDGTTAIAYVKQRHGESFTISGLNADTLAEVTENLSTDDKKKDTLIATKDGTITLAEGVTIKDNKLTLEKGALAEGLITFKPTNATEANYEANNYTAAEMAFGEGVNKIDTAPTVSVTGSTGETYIKAYQEAFKEAKDTLASTQENPYFKQDLSFKAATTETEDAGTETDTEAAKTASYDYTSSYSAAYYTKLPGYSDEAAARAASGGNYTNQLEGYMAGEGETAYMYTKEGDHIAKQSLTISGLKTGLESTALVEKREGDAEDVGQNATILVDYTVKDEDGKTVTPIVTINAAALPDADDRSGTSISIGGTDVSKFKLALDDKITTGANEQMSEEVAFKVEETQEDGKGTGTYVVTLKGNTAGYKEVTEENKSLFPDNKVGDFAYLDAKGAQQFTLTGLASGLLDGTDPNGFKAALKAISDSANGDKLPAISFEIKKDYLADADTYAEDGKGTIKITYDGTVDIKNETATATKADTDKTTVALTVTEDLSLVKAEAATWSSKPTEDETPTVNFIYTTELTADSWELGKTDGSTTENTLTYTAAVGGDNLITLSGLKDSDTATIATTTAALNEKATPQPADTTGEALVKKTGDSYYDTALHTGVTSWYKAADVDVAEDGTVTLKSGTTQEKDAIAIVDADGKLLKGELKNYLFNLPKDTFDKTKSTKVKYTKGTVTGEDAPFSGDTIFIGFDGIIPVLEANKPPKADASLTADTDADATGKTYKYVAEHTPAYVLQSAEDAGQPTTFTYTPAVGNYGFTISGLPTGLKDEGADKTALTTEAKINEYFTFTPPTQDAPNGTVTLTNKAFGVTEGTDYGTSDKTFTLSNLKLDGDGDGTDDSYKASATAEATPYTIAFKLGDNQSTETGIETDGEAKLTATEPTETGATSATYTYTSEKTKAYFTLDDTTKTELTYTASTGGEELFTISGLAYSKAEDATEATTPKLTTYTKDETTGYSTSEVADQGDINVTITTDAEGNKTADVKLYKGALAGEPVEITAKTKEVDDKQVDLATCTLSLFTKTKYDAGLEGLTGNAKTTYETTYATKVVPTTADEAVGTLATVKDTDGTTDKAGEFTFTAGGYYTKTDNKVSFTGGADVINITGLTGSFIDGATISTSNITATDSTDGNIVYKITGTKTGAETPLELLKITFTPATGEDDKASYSVALGKDFKQAGANGAELSVALGTTVNADATIAFDMNGVTTSKADAEAELKYHKTKEAEGDTPAEYEHIYNTGGSTAGFTASEESGTKKLTWTEGTAIDFTITGLNSTVGTDDTAEDAKLISYTAAKEASGTEGEEGYQAATPATFKIDESALNGDNVKITATGIDDIVGEVTFTTGTENNATVAIDRGVEVKDSVLTYTEAGWHKGYLTAAEVAENKYGTVTNSDNAQIVYAKQRGGDTFTISGLNSDALTAITNALKDEAKKAKVVAEDATNTGTINVTNGEDDTDAKTYFTVNTTTGAVELQKAAQGTANIVFKNTTEEKTLADGSGYTAQTFTLAEGIPQVDMGAKNFTVPTTLKGTSYVEQYKTAYNTAYETARKAATGIDIKLDVAKAKNAQGQEVVGSYTYTSAYENAFFTALPTYNEIAAKLADKDSDTSTDINTLISEGLMAADGETKFDYTAQTTKTTFTISGLSTTESNVTSKFVEKLTGNETTGNAGIIVDYSNDLENKTNPTVTINAASVLDQTAGKVVALSDIKQNDKEATATLAFGEKLTEGSGEIMSETVSFNVEETQEDGKGTGTYVVTLAGNTAGYVEVTDKNIAQFEGHEPAVKVGNFVNLEAKGAQQFTLTGLKSGLLDETDSTGFKAALQAINTKANGDKLATISVAMKKEYLAESYQNEDTIKITYNGTVTNTPEHSAVTENKVEKANNDNTTVALTATEADLSLVEKSDGKWSQAVENEQPVAGKFVFTTGNSGDSWTLDKTTNDNDTLTYTASTGNETIITLTGLKSDVTDKTLLANTYTTDGENALTKLGFVPADASGKAYVRYTYQEYDEATDKLVPKVAYYDSSKVDVDEDGTVTLKSDTKEPGTEGTDAITLSTVTNYLVGLNKDAFDTSTMGAGEGQTPVVMTTTAVTNDDKDYKDKTFGVLFGDEATTTATEGTQTNATLTETKTEGTYDYVAAHKAHFFNDKAGTNTHTYTYCPAVGKYGFTISGLPTGKTIANINDLFEFKAPSTANKGVGSVTLTTAAFGAASFADYSTTDKASVISLTNIDLDGTDATTGTVDGTATNISIQLALPESDKGTGFYSEKTINKAGDVNAGTAAADGTYTYKYSTTSYFGYFDTDEAKTTVKYTAPVASEELFTISGLASGVYADTFNADGSLNKVYGINVDETSKVVTLYKDSLAGSNVTVTGDGVTLKLFDETAYNALTDADKAKYTTTGNNAKTPEDYYVPTTGVSNDASATAQDGTATFTAGYTEAFYTLNGTTGVTFTPQDGAPDQIKVTGLKSDITGDLSIATDQSNANKYTVSSNGTSLFIIEYHKGSTDDSATTYVDEGNPYYTVAIQPGALDTTNPNAAVAVTIEKEGITGNGAQAIFDTTAIASNLSQNVADDVLSEAAETTGTRTFTTKGKTAGYTLADDRTKLTWTDSDQKVFKFTGLSTGALSAQSDVVLAADQADGKYTFVIKPTTALDGKDVIITAEGINADNITATISTDLDKTVDGKTAINADITADETNNRVTYTAAGFQAGYLTAAQASSNTYGTVTVPENAKIVYAGQRGGETFTIDGLSGDVVSLITNRNKSETIPATDGTIVQGLKLSGTTLTVSGIALGTENIVFTNTTDKTKLEDPATAQTYTLELDTTAQVAAPTVSVASSVKPGTDYVTAYQDAFNDAVTETVKTDKNITKGASLMEHQDDAAAADANATSKVYDYVSSHTEAYFTALPTYDSKVYSMSNANGNTGGFEQDLQNQFMAADGYTVYKYKEAGDKTAFSIEGLATTTTDVEGNIDEIADANTATTKAIVVNTKDFTVTINDKSVLPTSPETNDIVKLSGDGVGSYTLAFGEALKTGANDVMSEEIKYSVVPNDSVKGTYTVTLAGKTAGYKEVDGTFVPQEQTGGQQFTITGLKSGLTSTEITKDLFVEDETTGNFTFKISNALLADKYDDKAEISITFNGTVTDVKSGTETEDKVTPNTDKTVAFNTDNLTNKEETSAAWKQEGDAFVYRTAMTADSWNPDNTNSASATAKLKYTASEGNDALISLSGLKSGVTVETLNKDFTPAYADANGKALVSETTYGLDDTTGKTTTIVKWYAADDTSKTAVVTETTVEGGATKTVVGKPAAYIVNLDDTVIDKTAMVTTGVTLTTTPKADVTDATYKNKDVFITFDGNTAQTGTPQQTAESLTQAKDADGTAVEGSYKYVAAHTPAYFSTETSETAANTQTIKYVQAVGQYGFTIKGLPKDTKTDSISDYFKFAQVENEDGTDTKDFTVTLTEKAFGTISEYTETKDSVISLTSIDLDGTETEAETGDANSIKLVLPDQNATNGFYTTKTESKAAGLDTDGATYIEGSSGAYTYDYNAASYYGYFALADETTATTVKYTAAETGANLFKISGLPSKTNVYLVDDGTHVGAISVDEESKVVTLRKDAFDKSNNVTIEGEDYKLAFFDEAAYKALPETLSDAEKAKFEAQIVDANIAHVSGKFEADENGDYTFTAGYTPEQYTLDSAQTTATLTDQIGYADEIAISGLAEGLGGEGYTLTDDEKGSYVLKDKDGKTVLEIVHNDAVADDPETEASEAKAEGYTVKLHDGALPATPDEITLNINADTDRKGDEPVAAFNIDKISDDKKPQKTYGSFEVTAVDEGEPVANNYTFTANGTTAGYKLDDDGKVVYATEEGRDTFTIEGIQAGITLAATKEDNDAVKQLKDKGIDIAAEKDAEGNDTDEFTVTLSEEVLADMDIKLEGDKYTLALADGIPQNADAATEAGGFTVNNGTATYKITKINKWYEASHNAYTFNPERGGATFDIKGLATTVTTDELNVKENAPIAIVESGVDSEDNITVTVTFNDTSIFGKGTIELDHEPGDGYEISMDVSANAKGEVKVADEQSDVAKDAAWNVADGKATYSAGGFDAYYQTAYGQDEDGEEDKTNLKSLTYVAEDPNKEKFALGGLNTTLTAEALESAIEFKDAEAEDEIPTVTISEAIHGASGATITSNVGGYSIIVDAATNLTGTKDADIFEVKAEGATVNGGGGNDTFEVTEAASVDGGAGNDIFSVNAEGAIVDGGAGNDTFNVTAGTVVFGEGADTVNFENSEDLTIKADEYAYTFEGDNVVLKNGDNTLTLVNAGGSTINFVDSEGNKSTVVFDAELFNGLQFNKEEQSTSVTVLENYTGKQVGPAEFAANNASATIEKIDASKYKNADEEGLAITGTALNNDIIGTAYGDTIDAGESNKDSSNTIKGGTGDDLFIYRDGKLTITDFKSVEDETDALQLMIGGTSSVQHEVKEVAISGNTLTFTLDEGSIELKDVFSTKVTEVDVAISDAQGDEISAYNYDKSGVVTDGEESATLLSNFSKSEYTGANIDASAVSKALKLTLTDSGTVKGGKGADTFIIDEGASAVVIENYTADDKINFKALNKDISGVSGRVSGDDVVLSCTGGESETVSVTVTGGAGKAINLVDNSGKVLASNVYSEIGIFNDKQTAITLAATATNFDANVYDGLASIDASAVTSAITVTANDTVKSYILGSDSAALVLNGGSKDDMLIAGSKGATLNGGGGTNTIVAGDGADVIVLNGGNDLVEGFNAKVDKLVTGGTSGAAELVSNELKANKSVYNLALEFDNGSKVTLAGVDSVTAVSIDNTAYTFGEGFVQIGTEVTLASNYDTKKAYAAADSITAVDATALTNGVSIIGGLSTTEIAGGAGNDYLGGVAKKLELTGGDGKDTFAYIGGAVSIADFAPSADAISLEEFTVTGLSAVTVTDEKVTLDFGQGNTLTFKDAENAEVNVFDAENTKGKKFNFATGEITSGKEQILLAGGTSVAIGDDYKYTLVTAAGDNITLDASATEKTKLALTLMNGGSAVGGDKDDTLTATAGGSLTGGLGADTFVFGGGNATITDYNAAQKDKIVSASDLTLSTVVSYSADKKDVILTYTDEGQVTNTLYIKDGADKALTLDGKSSTFSGQGTLNSAKTAISLAADTSEFIVNDTDYTKLSSIDASRVTVPGATITAGDVNTTITGGEVGLKLTGGTKNDVIISGDGADTIFVGAGGNDSLQNFDATKDALATVAGAKIDDAAIDTKKDTLTLTLTTPENDKGKTSTSKVVVENITVDDGAAKVSVNGAEWTFSEDIIKKGDAVQLTSKYTEKAYEADETISAVDATATKGLTLSGGNPYAVTLTGSEKGADTFVYDGGNDVITNYGKGKDVISLSSDAYDMSDLSGVKVTATNPDDAKDKSGTIALSFKKGDKTAETLSLNVEDTTKPVTIANNDTPKGTAYTFKDNAIAIGTKAITLLSGSDTLNVAEAADGSLKGYTSIALNYTATVTAAPKGSNVTLLKGGEITGDKGKDTLKAAGEGTAVLEGKGGADTFIYDGGDVTVTDYMQSDKDVVSIAADWNVSGITVGTEATTLSLSKGDDTGSLILTGVDSDTEVLFASGGGKATKSYFSNGKILDGQDDRKIKSAIAVGTADFSTLYDNATGAKDTIASLPEDDSKAARSKLEDYYKALVTITSGGNNADVTGNSKNNIITLANGGTAKGGIGNDTYIIGDEAVISDFGINAKTVMNTEGNGLIKLPTKVNTAADSKKDSIPAYSADVYAPGKDKVQVDGKIVGVTFSDDIAVPESKKDTTVSAANSFSVTLTVDTDTTTETEGDTFTVVLQNIQREAKYDKKTDSYLNKNSDYKDISSLQIYELDGTKYKQVKVDALITLANNADAPDFGSADLDDIMDVTPAVTTGDSGKTKDADSFIITGSGDDSSDLTSKKN